MTTLFVSDLHLHPARPEATDCFLRFLGDEARQASALYILGDLFEAWIGDDVTAPHDLAVMNALRDYTTAGRPCFFLRGNRDFLIGERFGRQTGVALLPDETVIEVAGMRILVLHGDGLCTDDHAYQRYRSIVRWRGTQRLFLALPRGMRSRIAGVARGQSSAANLRKSAAIMDVNDSAVADALQKYGVSIMIHGHTHRPAIHRLPGPGQGGMRIVLGDWYARGSVLQWTRAGPELRELAFA
jgi:UDP-2,3-diacylglucosamine hydrolase